jgi:hypothetical protein
MERYTERHCGVAVIKDRNKLKAAMQRLAEYEEIGISPERIREMDKIYSDMCNILNEKWIPVKERLPEDEKVMLVSCETKKGVKSTNIAYYSGGYWNGRGNTSGITAWMPLPEPYDPDKPKKSPWNPMDEPPSDDRCILVSIEEDDVPMIARYHRDDDGGGTYCFVATRDPLLNYDIFVNGWMELPKCKKD